MTTQAPTYVAGEDIGPSLFAKQDGDYDHQILKAGLGGDAIGVTHEGTREAPIPGVTAYAAKSGESVRVYGPGETCEVLVGSTAILAGEYVQPDSNSKAAPGEHGRRSGGRALAAGSASGKVRIVVERVLIDKSDTVLAKTADYTVTRRDLGKVLTNTGASGTITLALPAALVGDVVQARVAVAQQLRLDPNGTETIALPSTGVQGAAGKYLVADAIGEGVILECRVAGTWDVVSYTGTWTAEA